MMRRRSGLDMQPMQASRGQRFHPCLTWAGRVSSSFQRLQRLYAAILELKKRFARLISSFVRRARTILFPLGRRRWRWPLGGMARRTRPFPQAIAGRRATEAGLRPGTWNAIRIFQGCNLCVMRLPSASATLSVQCAIAKMSDRWKSNFRVEVQEFINGRCPLGAERRAFTALRIFRQNFVTQS